MTVHLCVTQSNTLITSSEKKKIVFVRKGKYITYSVSLYLSYSYTFFSIRSKTPNDQ